MAPLWIMTLSQMRNAEFTKDAAQGRIGEVSFLPLLINSPGTHSA